MGNNGDHPNAPPPEAPKIINKRSRFITTITITAIPIATKNKKPTTLTICSVLVVGFLGADLELPTGSLTTMSWWVGLIGCGGGRCRE